VVSRLESERSGLMITSCMKNMLDTLGNCGEAAAYYRGQNLLMVNVLFAELFERSPEEFKDMPLVEICHNESIEMIQDFIRRRAHEDTDVPISYESSFTTPGNPKIIMRVIALKMKKNEGEVLLILRKK
jgi:hypothetical protein